MVHANTISRMSRSIFRAMPSLSLPDYPVQENQALPSIRSLPRDSVAMWNHFRHTPANFLDRWISQMLTSSRVSHPQSLSTRNQLIAIHAQQWERLLRFMTTYVFSLREPVDRTARNAQSQFLGRVHNRSWTKFLNCLPQQNFKF